MQPTIPQVHLVVCLDSDLAPGPVLQALDGIRSKYWQQEVVCLCDSSWQTFIGNEAALVCLDREAIYKEENGSEISKSLDALLSQLDDFDIKQVTVVGELRWGRWLQSYFDSRNIEKQNEIFIEKPKSSLQIVNAICHNLNIEQALIKNTGAQSLFIDPYKNGKICAQFINIVDGLDKKLIPTWLRIICDTDDIGFLKKMRLEHMLIERAEADVHLSTRPILCFDENSVYVQTSRSYKVAVLSENAERSMFVPGDMHISSENKIDLIEVANILNYWRADRLQELSFQWLSMGIDIHVVESSQHGLALRNLMSYSSDLDNCHHILTLYERNLKVQRARDLQHIILDLRRANRQSSDSISFSIKLLMLIVERMIISLRSRERLFQRLGSDHHRILIAEAIFDRLYTSNSNLDSAKCLQEFLLFLDFLIRIDAENDQFTFTGSQKESA